MKLRKLNLSKMKLLAVGTLMAVVVSGCGAGDTTGVVAGTLQSEAPTVTDEGQVAISTASVTAKPVQTSLEGGILDPSEMFTDRDLNQTPDLDEAVYYNLESSGNVTISQEGVYVLEGEATDVTVTVAAGTEAVVQLVLNGLTVTNQNSPVIYVESADKVMITTTESDNYMAVTGLGTIIGETTLDSVIFSKEDLVLNGRGTLTIEASKLNGIVGKDDLKITGGTITITAFLDGVEANDSIRIYEGTLNVTAGKDAFHSENEADNSLGYIYIGGGNLTIRAADDAIRATSLLMIDAGTITIESCMEGIEGTYVQINGGVIDINSNDDGINATNKSPYEVVIEVNGGTISVVMANGDTDGFDANGSIYINGGTIEVRGQSAFDADLAAELNGGTVIVNGEQITEISVQMMGGGGRMGGGARPTR